MITYIYICVCVCVCVCMYLNKIFFVWNYDFIYMIMIDLTMKLFWYPANGGYSLVLWYLANGGYPLVFWYPNQWGLFFGILIPKLMEVIHWYSNAQSWGYNVTIVIRLLRIWIMFQALNYFESLKWHMWFWQCLM